MPFFINKKFNNFRRLTKKQNLKKAKRKEGEKFFALFFPFIAGVAIINAIDPSLPLTCGPRYG